MDGAVNPGQSNTFATLRSIMVEQQIRRRGVSDERVLKAMGSVQSQQTSSPCSISQYAALAAL